MTSDSLLPTKMAEDEVLCLTPPTRREAEAIFRAKIKRKKEEEERSAQLARVWWYRIWKEPKFSAQGGPVSGGYMPGGKAWILNDYRCGLLNSKTIFF